MRQDTRRGVGIVGDDAGEDSGPVNGSRSRRRSACRPLLVALAFGGLAVAACSSSTNGAGGDDGGKGKDTGAGEADGGEKADGKADAKSDGSRDSESDSRTERDAHGDTSPEDGSTDDGSTADDGSAADGEEGDDAADGEATCGVLGKACCSGSCNKDLVCLEKTSCSCVKALYGDYILRADGKILEEGSAASGAETPVLDATSAAPLTGVVDVEDGLYHGCATLSGGTVSCWRTNATFGNRYGQLGNGTPDTTTGAIFRATQVLTAANTPLTDVVAIAPGSSNTACAVTSDGSLYCWGDLTWIVNDGTTLTSGYAQAITTDGSTPLAGVKQAAIGFGHACAVVKGKSANEVWCWGYNAVGSENLGLGDSVNRQYPTKVPGLTSPTKVVIVEYSSGYTPASTCAIDGANVRCWGYNVAGQTGVNNTTNPTLGPTLVVRMGGTAALDGVVDLEGGAENACALRTDHSLWCWGSGYKDYASNYGVTNVVSAGWAADPRLLTSDGTYHIGTTTRSPNCGVL